MNDSISRKSVSAWLYNMGHEKLSEYVLDKKRFPSVDRPQGWWIYAGIDLDGTWYCRCSKCLGEVKNRIYPHCPYCLAKMERADDE